MSKSVRRQPCIIIQSMICVITSLLESTAFGQMLQPGVLLERLKSIDSVYAAGLTVSGSHVTSDRYYSRPPLKQEWQLTMCEGKIAPTMSFLRVGQKP